MPKATVKIALMKAYLFPGLTLSPLVVRRIARQTPADRMDVETGPGRFTPREVIAHLADWEPILLGRMRQCVSDPGSKIKAYDEEQMAVDNGYATSDPDTMVERFVQARQATVTWLESLTPEQWTSQAVHEERGPMSVLDMANAMVGHDMYHIEQLTAYQETTD